MNSFGIKFKITTFGESHGKAVGCVLDGVPSGLNMDEAFIQSELNRRRPGQNEFSTARSEDDKVEILSGVFEGKSSGSPIAMVIYNTDQKSKDYSNIKDIFRPSHADFTYHHKYGFRDYRGGGRSSARESAARVAGGAIAKTLLSELGIVIRSGVCEIDGIRATSFDYDRVKSSPIYALDGEAEKLQSEAILKAKNEHDSVGGVVRLSILNTPIALGEPLYYKLDALLADAMMGINAVKAVEIGEGIQASRLKGSQNNDAITKDGFATNHSGGILGGLSNGDEIVLHIYFKPTPSIFKNQKTIDIYGNEVDFALKGRHDPCVAIRGSVVCESMAALVLADMLLLNMASRVDGIKSYYKR